MLNITNNDGYPLYQAVWRTVNEFISQQQMPLNELKTRQRQHWPVSSWFAEVIRLHVRYFTQRCRIITLGLLHRRNFNVEKNGDVPGHPDVRSTIYTIYTIHSKNDNVSASWRQKRRLFAIIISTHFPSNPRELWEKCKDDMYRRHFAWSTYPSVHPHLEINEEMHNQALALIEDIFYLMRGILLVKLGMSAPSNHVNVITIQMH